MGTKDEYLYKFFYFGGKVQERICMQLMHTMEAAEICRIRKRFLNAVNFFKNPSLLGAALGGS